MSTSSAATAAPQQINVADLGLPQLVEVKRQIEEELSHLTNSFAQLKQAQSKFRSCIESAKEVKSDNKGKTILVPLTSSLYVPGKLRDVENVIIDVGTGYYVQKTRAQTVKYYEDKVEYIKTKLDGLQETIEKKQDNMNYLVNVIQSKLQTQVPSKD
ncbi:Prefoldin-domain-containing protein [Multifurca ochricompacta]|uniref:Prefoldin-domain-containing protein n=1 Tax=Multifurca ochricompacta TaxID=376703 RepID=A0AAD4LX01_9AGAM|nr:Prefoldin-domain-containing protein [Multifurca ochricompacta]